MEINLALAQYPLVKFLTWETWQAHTEAWVRQAAGKGAKLVVFPEYGAMELASLLDPAICQDLHASIHAIQFYLEDFKRFYLSLSKQYQLVIVAPSFPVAVNGSFVNRAFVAASNGNLSYQDKLFMTRFEKEEWHIASGDPILRVFRTAHVTFGIQICYDCEFAIGSQLLAQAGAQLLVVPSCTETIRGATRVHVGARARALEQQCYVGVAQTVGDATWSPAVDLNYGYSAIYCSPDLGLPEQGVVAQQLPQTPGWLIEKLDLSANDVVREKGQVYNFKDNQSIAMQRDGKYIAIEWVEM